MLNKILNKLGLAQDDQAAGDERERSADEDDEQEIDLGDTEHSTGYKPEQILPLVEFFPIGAKLRYFPEFKKDVLLDTVITGYFINQHFLYSMDAMERDEQGQLTGFRVPDLETSIGIAHVKQFKILVPDTSHLETTLDYDRLAAIGRNRQFVTGNAISLISNQGRKFVSLDTVVSKRQILKQGPYAQSKMVFLTPSLNTLAIADQRKKPRTEGDVPVMFTPPNQASPIACRLIDISEDDVHVRVTDSAVTLPVMALRDEVLLEIDLGGSQRKYLVRAAVLRYAPDNCLVKMKSIVRKGKDLALTPLDFIELKSGIVNYTPSKASPAEKPATVILIVEDDQDLRGMIRTTLENGSRVIHEAENAAQVLKMTTSIHPDILLIDIGLEGPVDGLSLCEKLLGDSSFRKLQVLVVTGSHSPAHIEKARNLGLNVYINKPFSPKKLEALVSQIEARSSVMPVIPPVDD